MAKDTNILIRLVIDRALEDEQQTRMLQVFIASQMPELHRTISLPQNNGPDTLLNFLSRYVQHVPDFLEALSELTHDAGIYSSVINIIKLAQSYFDPHSLNPIQPRSMVALLHHAYLAHRLMEELNDRFMALVGIPLIPMDVSVSNAIVYDIIGADFGDKLDRVVSFSLDTYFEDLSELENAKFSAYVLACKEQGWTDTLKDWPCLASCSSIGLSLSESTHTSHLH